MTKPQQVHIIMQFLDKVGGDDEPVAAFLNSDIAEKVALRLDTTTRKYHYLWTVDLNPASIILTDQEVFVANLLRQPYTQEIT